MDIVIFVVLALLGVIAFRLDQAQERRDRAQEQRKEDDWLRYKQQLASPQNERIPCGTLTWENSYVEAERLLNKLKLTGSFDLSDLGIHDLDDFRVVSVSRTDAIKAIAKALRESDGEPVRFVKFEPAFVFANNEVVAWRSGRSEIGDRFIIDEQNELRRISEAQYEHLNRTLYGDKLSVPFAPVRKSP